MASEPDISGLGRMPGGRGGQPPMGEVKSSVGSLDVGKWDKIKAKADGLLSVFKALGPVFDSLSKSLDGTNSRLEKMVSLGDKAAKAATAAGGGGSGGSTPRSASSPSFGGPNARNNSAASASDVASGSYGSGGPGIEGMSFSPGGGGGGPGGPGGGGGATGGGGGIMPWGSMASSFMDVVADVIKGSIQYYYNRIEGPTGNRNAMLRASQVLGPQATYTGTQVGQLVQGLSSRTPVMGSFSDILGTIAAGQDVGAFLSIDGRTQGYEQRAGFFEAVRQMQTLTPGVGAAQIAQNLGSYINNTGSQRMGTFFGGGAFTAMGRGGRYKNLGEWARGISKFLEQQRPGADRGKPFTAEELAAQNFPGSNINAWFQFMGVPETMVDYWWQYSVAQARDGGGASDIMRIVKEQRGIDLSHERLRNITLGSQREFMMGTSMYPLYAGREGADRRFQVAMQGMDMSLAQMSRDTGLGSLLALLPTPLAEMLMPMALKMASSPVGMGTAVAGTVLGALTGDPIGDPGGPIGDWGPFGGTGTGSLAPDLARRIGAMQRANPAVQITSGHRDSFLQRRLGAKGIGRVGKASQSQHTKGNAADLGPVSQLPWIMANAHKFGIDLATGAGEPWHAQVAGTMPHRYVFGDPGAAMIGDWWDPRDWGGSWNDSIPGSGILEQLLGGGPSEVIKGLTMPEDSEAFGGVLKKFLQGDNGVELVDNAISLFTKVFTAPLGGMVKMLELLVGGNLNTSPSDYNELINGRSRINVNLPKYSGFTPETAAGGNVITFGDPSSSVPFVGGGSPINLTAAPIVFQNTFDMSGMSASNPADARIFAKTVASHLSDEMAVARIRKN